MSAYGIRLLRWAIAILYLWFGSLKLINASPAAELVVRTVFWLSPRMALVFIGSWEVLIGAGLLFTHPLVLRATLFLLWLQIAGTFQVFFLLPQAALQGGEPTPADAGRAVRHQESGAHRRRPGHWQHRAARDQGE
jgi:hypothetical protein